MTWSNKLFLATSDILCGTPTDAKTSEGLDYGYTLWLQTVTPPLIKRCATTYALARTLDVAPYDWRVLDVQLITPCVCAFTRPTHR
uniref:Uncharacterized protein n=1 Tax=Hyaloperonospora arabidopsidis (strain Emoy2) TaxID=559515 RepID=M4B3N7_HYAAE